MEVRTNEHRHLALLLTVGNQRVAYIEHDNGLELKSTMHATFEKEFPMVAIHQNTGLEYQAIEYARHYLGAVSDIYTYDEEVLITLIDIMTAGSEGMTHPAVLINTSAASDGFESLGCYASEEDAKLVARHLEGKFVVLTGAETLREWSPDLVIQLRQYLDPEAKPLPKTAWSGKQLLSTLEGVYKMAVTKKVEKKAAPKKVEKVAKERVAKKDGPVAIIWAYLDSKIERIKSGKLTRKDCFDALEEKGIVKGTMTVQAGRWAAERKVTFVKPVKEAKTAKKPADKATTKAAGKKPAQATSAAAKPVAAAKPAPLKPTPAGKPAGVSSI